MNKSNCPMGEAWATWSHCWPSDYSWTLGTLDICLSSIFKWFLGTCCVSWLFSTCGHWETNPKCFSLNHHNLHVTYTSIQISFFRKLLGMLDLLQVPGVQEKECIYVHIWLLRLDFDLDGHHFRYASFRRPQVAPGLMLLECSGHLQNSLSFISGAVDKYCSIWKCTTGCLSYCQLRFNNRLLQA